MPKCSLGELTDMLQNNHRDFSNSSTCALGTQGYKLTTGAFPTLAHEPLMHSCVLK